MYMFVWVCTGTFGCACTYGMEARGLFHISSSIAFHLFWDGSFHWTWRSSRLAGQGTPRNFLSPKNPSLGFQTHAATLLEKFLSLHVRGVSYCRFWCWFDPRVLAPNFDLSFMTATFCLVYLSFEVYKSYLSFLKLQNLFFEYYNILF